MRASCTNAGLPAYSASTSTSGPTRSKIGPRMKTISIGSGFDEEGPLTTSLCTCRPYPLRSTVMSSKPSDSCWGFFTSVASRIAPAHVPKMALSSAANFLIASYKPSSCRNCNCVVLSPPGRINPSQLSSSAGVRTSTVSMAMPASMAACAAKSPCTAKIPIFTSHQIRGAPFSFPLAQPFRPALLTAASPPSRRQQILLFELPHIKAAHGLAQFFVRFQHRLRVFKMRGRLHHRLRASFRIAGFENPRADKYCLGSQAAHQRSIRRRRDSARREIRYRQFARLRHLANQIQRRAEFLCFMHQFVVAHGGEPLHLTHNRAHVPHRLYYIARAGFALGANHRRAFRHAAQRFTQIARATNERHAEIMLPDVILFIGGSQNFAFVDKIHFKCLQDLGLDKMSDTHLGHHRNGNCLHDLADDFDGCHARHAALFANVGWYALERHHRASSGFLRDLRLLGVGDIHNHAALEHFRQADLHAPFVRRVSVSVPAAVHFLHVHVSLSPLSILSAPSSKALKLSFPPLHR